MAWLFAFAVATATVIAAVSIAGTVVVVTVATAGIWIRGAMIRRQNNGGDADGFVGF